MTDTNEMRRLLEKATPTPWIVQKDDYWDSWLVTGPAYEIVPGWPRKEPEAFDDGTACGEYGPCCTEDTRDLIVAAVNALPAMLDELDALRADLREAVQLLRAFRRDRHTIADWEPIWERADELVEKHKETP